MSGSLAAFFGLSTLGLVGYALFIEPKYLLVVASIPFVVYPWGKFFTLQVAAACGTQVEIDSTGMICTRGTRQQSLQWAEVIELSHGAHDSQTWIFGTANGTRLAFSPSWYASPIRPVPELAEAIQIGLEHSAAALPPRDRVIVRDSSFDRSITLSGLFMLACFTIPITYALAAVPRAFVPLPALGLGALAVLAGFAVSLNAILHVLRACVEVAPDGLTIRSAFKERLLPRSSISVHHEATADHYGQPIWITTVKGCGRPVVLTSSQEGYFEARAILTTEAS